LRQFHYGNHREHQVSQPNSRTVRQSRQVGAKLIKFTGFDFADRAGKKVQKKWYGQGGFTGPQHGKKKLQSS